MVKIPQKSDPLFSSSKELCIAKFKEWWTTKELSRIISLINPSILRLFVDDASKISNPDKLSEILYDIIGTRFLRNIENDTAKRKKFLRLILDTLIAKRFIDEKTIIQAARETKPKKTKNIRTLDDAINLDATSKWCLKLATELGLPSSVAEKEHVEPVPDTETIEPHSQLNPLYDYQFSTGLFVRGMLEGTNLDDEGRQIKRKLIAVPTGAGKTRMIVETLIEWLNDDKPSKNEQQSNSKFILWVAQSGELCEQAFSTFKSVFESTGRRGTTLRLHRFWGSGGSLPKLGMDDLLDEKGVIVATIQSLHKIFKNQPKQLEFLSKLTSCIIVDEAHHSTADTYSHVLRKMGFNWDNKKKEISELGIILIGLTATPFRGAGNNSETKKLERWYNKVYFPTIPFHEDTDNYEPHALIDCQSLAFVDEDVRILGERSYDRDGFIKEDDYYWKIVKIKKHIETDSDKKNDQHQDEWTFEKTKNINFKFPNEGEYEITLKVTDNEGDSNSVSTCITIKPQTQELEIASSQKQKQLYHKLIKRKILCEVYHKILESECIELTSKDVDHMKQFGEFRKETLKNIGNNPARNKLILDEIYDFKKSGRKKILFFGCSVDHSRQIAMALKIIHGMNVRYVDSKMDIDSRVNAIEQFRSGDVEVICNFDVLTTGFDAPNIDCVFVGRPARSTLLYTQMIGRGMRGSKSGGTSDVIIVDIDDNFQLQDRHHAQDHITELGWKLFQEYWKPWQEEMPKEIPQTITKPEISDIIYTYSCSNCGDNAKGVESIKKIFGIEGPTQTLIEYLEAKNYGALPSECEKCRRKEESQPEPVSQDADPLAERTSNQTNIQDAEKPIPTTGSEIKEYTSEKIDEKFEDLRNKYYGHIPTSRQFKDSTSSEILEIMSHLYGDYSDYLRAKGILIQGDVILEDNLYDEYFELYDEVKRPISKEMLDRYGDYRIEDYEECFGTFEKFEKIIDELIYRSQNLNPLITRNDLHHDYKQVKEELGTEPHFEQMKTMSYLGIEYYVGLFGTFGRFKHITKLNPNDRLIMQNLQEDFLKIKHMLKVVPNLRQMRSYSQYGHKLEELYSESGTESEYNVNYGQFLKDIGVTDKPIEDPIPVSTKKVVQEKLLLEFKENVTRFKKYKAMDLFLDANPIRYIEWFGSKDGFVDFLRKIDHSYPMLYANRQDARLPENKEKTEQKKSQQEKIGDISKKKSNICPKCSSSLIREGSGAICSNCDYYEFS